MRQFAIIPLQILSLAFITGCDKTKDASSASRPATQPGSIPKREELLGEWKVFGEGAASTLLLNEDGTFSNTPASPLDPAFKGTWTLTGANFTMSVTNAKGKTRADTSSLKWDKDGVILMSSREFRQPLRMSRGDWPKEAYEPVKK